MKTTHPGRRAAVACALIVLFSALLALPATAQKSARPVECKGTCWSAERGVWSSSQPASSAETAPPSDEVKGGTEPSAFVLPEYCGAAELSGADISVLDTALGAVGLPGMSGADGDESSYERASRMRSNQRMTYGERYRRNPDGSYGSRSSSRWDSGNVGDRLLEQALSAGSGYFSSWAEGWLGGFGKARISVRVNDEGDVTGSGDFLYPIYDSESTTFFTQVGLRTMSGDRVIGNFGLGQRFFPAENLALGYNVFLDQDFSRNHTRGGAGLEAWYDWLRLSANYYTPLSGWKDSKDYDSRFVEERPAEGYDARLTGYLPFYRNLAVTGAYEKWKGDHVGAFGRDDFLNKNPKVWSYGLEWTPVPILSTSVNQRHSGGQKETQFGLTFNFNFDMPWEDQIASNTVAEMRTVDGSRHDFVNRQNEMILEYREKEGVYNISLFRVLNASLNIFEFSLTTGFGQAAAGQVVTVSAGAGAAVLDPVTGLPATQFTTDANGHIQVQISPQAAGVTQVTLNVGKSSRTFALNVTPLGLLTLTAASGPHYAGDEVTLTATMLDGSGLPVPNAVLTWALVPDPTVGATLTTDGASSPTNASGVATAKVKSTVAQTVTVKVSGTVNGVIYEATVDVPIVANPNGLTLTAPSGPHYVGDEVTLTATMLDGPGQPVPNAALTWTLVPDPTVGATLTTDGASSPTNASGVATAKVKSTVPQTVTVKVSGTVNGVLYEATVDVPIAANTYTLEVSSPSLILNKPTSVIFTFKKNNVVMNAGTSVTFAPNGTNFDNLPAGTENLASGGTYTISNLTGKVAGAAITIEATVDGETVPCTVSVGIGPPTVLTITSNPSNVAANATASMAVKAEDEVGNPVPNVSISWKISTHGGNGTAMPWDFAATLNTTTNASGVATASNIANNMPKGGSYTSPVTGVNRRAVITAYVTGTPTIEISSAYFVFGADPATSSSPGNTFIIDGSGSGHSAIWSESNAFCQAQGGQLPSYGSGDGFGVIGGAAPSPDISAWPYGDYWSRKFESDGYHYYVRLDGGNVNTAGVLTDNSSNRAVCVK